MTRLFLIAAFLFAILAAIVGWLVVRPRRFRKRLKRAADRFSTQRQQAQQDFFEAASSSGKPRGLRWTKCDFHETASFALDRASGELYALVGTTIAFEAIEGGPMEDVEAVGNLRCGTAILVHRDDRWTSDGRAVFNLDPGQTIEHYQKSLVPLV